MVSACYGMCFHSNRLFNILKYDYLFASKVISADGAEMGALKSL